MIYAKCTLSPRLIYSHPNIELMAVSISTGCARFTLVNGYRSPAMCPPADFIDGITDVLSLCQTNDHEYILCGDYNVCGLKSPHYGELSSVLLSEYDMVQTVDEPTHKNSLLDLAYVPRSMLSNSVTSLMAPLEKHHSVVSVSITVPAHLPKPPVNEFWAWKRADWTRFVLLLTSLNLCLGISRTTSVDAACDYLIMAIIACAKMSIPKVISRR